MTKKSASDQGQAPQTVKISVRCNLYRDAIIVFRGLNLCDGHCTYGHHVQYTYTSYTECLNVIHTLHLLHILHKLYTLHWCGILCAVPCTGCAVAPCSVTNFVKKNIYFIIQIQVNGFYLYCRLGE